MGYPQPLGLSCFHEVEEQMQPPLNAGFANYVPTRNATLHSETQYGLPTPSSKQQQCFDDSVLANDVMWGMVLVGNISS